jgi:hypothetical protein
MIIWKHKIPLDNLHKGRLDVPISLPKDADILSLGVQDNLPVFWEQHLEQGTAPVMANRVFWLVMTGQPFDIPVESTFLGTVQLPSFGGELVLHVYVEQGISSEVTPNEAS